MHWNVWLVVSSVTSEHLSRQSLNGLQYLGQHYLGQHYLGQHDLGEHYLGQYSLCQHCLQLCLPRPKKNGQPTTIAEETSMRSRCSRLWSSKHPLGQHYVGQNCLAQHYLLDATPQQSCVALEASTT